MEESQELRKTGREWLLVVLKVVLSFHLSHWLSLLIIALAKVTYTFSDYGI